MTVEWRPEQVTRFWNYLAKHNSGEFFSEKCAPALASRLMRLRPSIVVDIGCGTGPLIEELSHRGAQCIGIDSSQEALDMARQRTPMATFHMGSVTGVPFEDSSFDTATLIEVVEHLDDETLHAALREAHRILRSGGTLMVTTPNDEDLEASMRECPNCGAEFHIYQHVRSWTADSLRDALARAGFTKVDVEAVAFAERGTAWGRLLPLAYRVFRRRPPRLLALARAAK